MPATHLLLVATGKYQDANTALAEEQWNCTIRLALQGGGVSDAGEVEDWEPDLHTVTEDATEYIVEGNWKRESTPLVQTFFPTEFLKNEGNTAWTALMANGPVSNKAKIMTLTVYPITAPQGRVAEVSGQPGVKARATLTYKAGFEPIGQSGDMASADVSGNLSWRTIRADGKGRGRMYLPAIRNIYLSSAADTQGVFDSQYQTTTSTAAAQFLSDLSGSSGGFNYDPCVVPSTYTTYSKILSVSVGRNPATQRRRTNRVSEEYMSVPKA